MKHIELMNSMSIEEMGPPNITWKWDPGAAEPRISIKQKLYCPAAPSNHYWTIQYP